MNEETSQLEASNTAAAFQYQTIYLHCPAVTTTQLHKHTHILIQICKQMYTYITHAQSKPKSPACFNLSYARRQHDAHHAYESYRHLAVWFGL